MSLAAKSPLRRALGQRGQGFASSAALNAPAAGSGTLTVSPATAAASMRPMNRAMSGTFIGSRLEPADPSLGKIFDFENHWLFYSLDTGQYQALVAQLNQLGVQQERNHQLATGLE